MQSWHTEIMALLEGSQRGVVVFDVDLTILGFSSDTESLRPGIPELFADILLLGLEIKLWSAAGKAHCERVIAEHSLCELISSCHDKADYPMRTRTAMMRLGAAPVLVVDDDVTEKVLGWPFYLIEPYWGPEDD